LEVPQELAQARIARPEFILDYAGENEAVIVAEPSVRKAEDADEHARFMQSQTQNHDTR
jgi:hypothetical protein